MKLRRNLFLGTLVTIALSQAAQADTYTWNGSTTGGTTGASDTWDTATANWTGFATTWPAVSTNDDDAVFGGTAGAVTIATGGVTANELSFAADAYILSGAGITLDGTTPTITTADSTLTTISSIISGSAGLTKAGTGDLNLSGANNYTGVTNINAGTLIAGNAAALGSNVDGTTVTANGTLDVGGQNLGTEVVTISGAGPFGDGAIVNSGAIQINALGRIVLAGNATIGGSVRWDLRNSTPTLNMAGFTLTKTGANYLGLVGATISNPGNVIVNQGELNLTFVSTFGGISATNTVTVNTGGILGFYQTSNIHGSTLTLNDGSTLRGESGSGTQNTWAGPINVADEVTLDADGILNLPANITGTANLTKTGTNTAILSGTNSITSTALTISGGSLQINTPASLPNAPSISVASGASGALVLGNSITVGSGKTLTIAGGGANGGFYGALATAAINTGTSEWQGSVIIGEATGTRVGSLGGILHISGDISETNVGSALIIRNDESVNGTVILSGNNIHTGTTTLSAAGLRIGSATALGSGPFLVDNGTRIASITSTDTTPRTIANATTLNGGTGVLTLGDATRNGKLTFSNTLALGTAARPVAVNSEAEFAGIVSGALGGITKSGAGTLILSGNNDYTGVTTVAAGTLKLDYTTNDGSKLSDGAALILAGGTLELVGNSLVAEEVLGTTLTTNTASTVTRSSGNAVLQMNAITRNSGATINFAQSGIATTETLNNAGGILGAWATVGGTDWAVNSTNAADGPITALSSDTLSSTAANAAGTYTAAHITIDSNQAPDAAITPNSLRFNGPAANTLTLQGANTIASGGILVTTNTGTNTSTLTGGTLTGPVSGDLVIQQNNPSGNLEIASQIINNTATNVVKLGVGSATLSGANTYTGLTSIIGGTLKAGSISAFTNKGGLSMASTGIFDLNGFNATFTTLASAATNVITNSSSATGASNAAAVGTPAGAGVYVDALTFSTAAQAIAAQVTDGATRKTQVVINNSSSSTNLAGITNTANSFSGGLVLPNTASGTRLRINSAITGTPFGTGPIIIGQAATDKAQILLDSTAAINLANDVFINTAVGTDAIGAFRVDTAGHTLSGKITANLAAARFATGSGKTASVSVTGQVTGSNGLILDTAAGTTLLTVTLNNGTANPNNYQGATIINQGAAAGRSSTLKLGAASQIPTGASAGNVTVTTVGTGTGTLDLNGFSQQINGLSGSGTVDGNAAGTAGSNTLTVGDNNATGTANTFSGTIKNTLGTLALTKIGSGTLTLSGNNSFAGNLNIGSTGLVTLGHNSAAGTGTITLQSTVANTNNILALSGGRTIANNLIFDSATGRNNIASTGAGASALTGNIAINNTGSNIQIIANNSSNALMTIGKSDLTSTITAATFASNFSFRGSSTGGGVINSVFNAPSMVVDFNGTTNWTINSTGNNWGATTGIIGAGNLILGASDALDTGSRLDHGGAGDLILNGFNQTIAGLNRTPAVANAQIINSHATTNATLTIAGMASDMTYANVIADGGAAKLALEMNSANRTQTLTATNTYTGNTTVTAGTLSLGNGATNTGLADGADVIIAASATLNLNYTGTDTVDELWINGVQKSPGVYGSTDPSGQITGLGTLTVQNGPSGDDYTTWANTFTPPTGLPGADDDGDGLTNFEEYAFGLDPKSASSVSPITQQLNKTSGTFKYTRRATPATTGVTYTYESSTTLSGVWDPVTPAVTPTSNGATPTEEITVTVPGTPLTDPKFFIRVKATKP